MRADTIIPAAIFFSSSAKPAETDLQSPYIREAIETFIRFAWSKSATLSGACCPIMSFPYTYISCPCTNVSTPLNLTEGRQDQDEDQERTFDPRSPRANFSLYPPEHLLYCEECQEIRCPRCILEEIVCWYCPNCLFEMPLTLVKSEGGR